MKGQYHPDQTWKNIWTMLRTGRRKRPVLSCRNCASGVSPTGKYYHYGLCFLGCMLGSLFYNVLREEIASLGAMLTPAGSGKIILILLEVCVALVFLLPFLLVSLPIMALLFFRFSTWTPAVPSEKNQGKS